VTTQELIRYIYEPPLEETAFEGEQMLGERAVILLSKYGAGALGELERRFAGQVSFGSVAPLAAVEISQKIQEYLTEGGLAGGAGGRARASGRVASEEAVDFLLRAKTAEYGSKGVFWGPAAFHASDGGLEYSDSRIGSRKFAGRQTLLSDGVAFWAMNYIGRVLIEGFSSSFLREALLMATTDSPYRGPKEHFKGHYAYTCSADGDFSWFYGYEEILYEGDRVYEGAFHGGFVTL